MLRWVPPNHVYGFRIRATLRDRSVWYDINALSGRHFFLLGLLLIALELSLPPAAQRPTLRAIALMGLAVIVVVDWRAANRLERERDAGPAHP